MSESDGRAKVTLSRHTIHNPGDPRHFMRIKPVKGRVRILLGETVLADSRNALRLLEAGHDVYDPVLYIPLALVGAAQWGMHGLFVGLVVGDWLAGGFSMWLVRWLCRRCER